MSTILNTNGAELEIPALLPEQRGDFFVITADWNPNITFPLRDAAIEVLRKGGVSEKRIHSLSVPGTVELVNAAAVTMENTNAAAIIVIGCVIRGDTPHFDYVCEIAASGVAHLNAKGKAPVIFGVLTVDNLQQAVERAGGALGNKGAEAAAAAITMANLPFKLYRR
ncbi:MAG: 6,7-dimethyl-8-ribityllumazine synthase [Muribaculaceae bacterium]|nr:6,7-dimethyl-8-ribityllumazine synthase [Muribaculaceae bacterium]MDE6755316.1 6,7-dimethyl-8-ribityllumazine synthase [Muribaculaceae bacterium]